MTRHGKIHKIGIAEVDLGDAARTLHHNGIVFSSQAVESRTHLLTIIRHISFLRLSMSPPILIGTLIAHGLAMEHHLRGVVALGFQEQGVHIRLTGDASGLSLNSLGTTYLQTIGRGIRVEGHVLCLEGGRMIAVLQEDSAKCCSEDALTHIAARPHKHQRMQCLVSLIHRSLPGLSCSASSKVRMALQRVAARLLPPLRPSTMILGIWRKGLTMCFDSRT